VSELSEATRQKLLAVTTATLTSCLFKRGFRNLWMQGVHPINPHLRMCGPAFTLRTIPAREDLDAMGGYADPEHPQRKAIETCPPGHVLVVDSRKDARAASGGDILLTRLMIRGCAGAVTDGGFRDTPAIQKIEFPVYHARPSAPTAPILHHSADIGLPIGCGDVPVYPGDIVVGDGEGVIVVPAHLAEEVADEAFEMTIYEDFVEEKVREGRRLPGLYPASDASREEFKVWRKAQGR
jgi:regulator of RNase E activity RraA